MRACSCLAFLCGAGGQSSCRCSCTQATACWWHRARASPQRGIIDRRDQDSLACSRETTATGSPKPAAGNSLLRVEPVSRIVASASKLLRPSSIHQPILGIVRLSANTQPYITLSCVLTIMSIRSTMTRNPVPRPVRRDHCPASSHRRRQMLTRLQHRSSVPCGVSAPEDVRPAGKICGSSPSSRADWMLPPCPPRALSPRRAPRAHASGASD